jgi:hypothetical protein
VYNDAVVSASLSKTQAIQMLCEHFTVAPIAFFLDKLISTDGYQFLDLYQTHISVLTNNITLYFFVPLIYSAFILLRPVA